MNSSTTGPQSADRNLLFGIIALQMDFITRDALINGMQAWALNKDHPLAEILQNQGVLAADNRSLLEALVDKHLTMHGGSVEQSLATMSSLGSVPNDLRQIADSDVQASLNQLPTRGFDVADSGATQAPTSAKVPGHRFRILRPHAKGGLGAVYVAHDEELHREVALKEIQERHADHPDNRNRFLLEAEITGRLEHPGIVPVYGLGHYGDGRPFYAMRFIRGDSLKDAIDRFYKAEGPNRDPGERALEHRKLLGRFIDVCNAMEYAHSRGVLHRDLKPGNIMLGNYGETLVVDWGLAKPLDRPESAPASAEGTIKPTSLSETTKTYIGQAMGTPQFMSPEQAAGRLDELGPASDIYSLGATLYCLLTGKPPFEQSDVGTILARVQRGEFRPPLAVNPQIPPPLVAICLKAMALKPQDRYRSAAALADDIEHWLADEPVSAYPEPWTARARRWISRHRTLVTGAAAAVLVGIISLSVATVLLTAANQRERLARQEAERQRQEAQRQEQIATQNYQLARQSVDRYHTEVSESVLLHEPGVEPLRKKLLEAAREFYAKFVDQHANDPGVHDEMAQALFRLGLISSEIDSRPQAVNLLKQASTIFASLIAADPSRTEYLRHQATCYHHLGRLSRLLDNTAEAEAYYQKALINWNQLAAAHPGDPTIQADLARSQLGLGNVYFLTHHMDQARAAYEKTRTIRQHLADAFPQNAEYERDLAITYNNLARCWTSAADLDKTESAYRQALTIQEKLVHDYPHIKQYQNDLAASQSNLGLWYSTTSQTAKAEACYQQAATLWTQLAEVHPAVTDFGSALVSTYNNLGNLYRIGHQGSRAEQAYLHACEFQQKLVETHPRVPAYLADLARFHRNLANIYRTTDRPAEADKAYHDALAIQERLVREHADLPQYEVDLASTWNDLGMLQRQQGKWDEAGVAYHRSLDLWSAVAKTLFHTPDYPLNRGASCCNLGDLTRDQAKYKEALDWYAQAIAQLEPAFRDAHNQRRARQPLCNCYWGRAEALTQLKQYSAALKDWQQAIELAGDDNRNWFRLYRLLTLAHTGDHAQATRDALGLLPGFGSSGDALYKCAAIFSVAASAVRDDGKLLPAERDHLANDYAHRAVEFLTQAVAGKDSAGSKRRLRLAKDTDFDSVRSRPEFKKLVESLPKTP